MLATVKAKDKTKLLFSWKGNGERYYLKGEDKKEETKQEIYIVHIRAQVHLVLIKGNCIKPGLRILTRLPRQESHGKPGWLPLSPDYILSSSSSTS